MTARPSFLENSGWNDATQEPITGDASARKYFRLHDGDKTAILMDATAARETLVPFARIHQHLHQLGFSVPAILDRDDKNGFLLLEDFGDETFSRLLERGQAAREKADEPSAVPAEELFALATDVLIALHKHPRAKPKRLRAYDPEKMYGDVELFSHDVSGPEKSEFKKIWLDVLPLAHQVPASLLLRDYHVANLMWLPGRDGVRQAGLLDFQDAYQGPITYDLMSLLEDARRDLPAGIKEKMVARYLAQFPDLDRKAFETSWAILAALRHTRVLAVFEKLSREGKPDYQKLHSPRVKRMLQAALEHPTLSALKRWFEHYAG